MRNLSNTCQRFDGKASTFSRILLLFVADCEDFVVFRTKKTAQNWLRFLFIYSAIELLRP